MGISSCTCWLLQHPELAFLHDWMPLRIVFSPVGVDILACCVDCVVCGVVKAVMTVVEAELTAVTNDCVELLLMGWL